MPIEVIFGFVLDFLFGDPRWLPHPVKLMGKVIAVLERWLRRFILWQRLAGILLVIIVVGASYFITGLIVTLAYEVHGILGIVVGAVLIWTTLAMRDLAFHAKWVWLPLMAGDVRRARQTVALMVGRDTDKLQEDGVVRACVETVAENTVDGVVSPLFFAFLGGAPLAMAFKAVSTLDSMVGYKTEKYIRFGWAAARLDDLANWIPARICGLLMPVAAFVCNEGFLPALRMVWRDGRKHESPNSAIPEAAMAGALKVQLGGLNYYGGEPSEKPLLGEALRPLHPDLIQDAVRIMYVTSLMAVFIGLLLSWVFEMPVLRV